MMVMVPTMTQLVSELPLLELDSNDQAKLYEHGQCSIHSDEVCGNLLTFKCGMYLRHTGGLVSLFKESKDRLAWTRDPSPRVF